MIWLAALILMFGIGVLDAYAIAAIWKMAVTPVFTTLPELQVYQAYLLNLMVSAFVHHPKVTPKMTGEQAMKLLGDMIWAILIRWGLVYAVYHWCVQ